MLLLSLSLNITDDVMKSVLGNVPVHFFTIHILVLQIFTGKYIGNYSTNFIHEKYFLGKDTGDTSFISALYNSIIHSVFL